MVPRKMGRAKRDGEWYDQTYSRESEKEHSGCLWKIQWSLCLTTLGQKPGGTFNQGTGLSPWLLDHWVGPPCFLSSCYGAIFRTQKVLPSSFYPFEGRSRGQTPLPAQLGISTWTLAKFVLVGEDSSKMRLGKLLGSVRVCHVSALGRGSSRWSKCLGRGQAGPSLRGAQHTCASGHTHTYSHRTHTLPSRSWTFFMQIFSCFLSFLSFFSSFSTSSLRS